MTSIIVTIYGAISAYGILIASSYSFAIPLHATNNVKFESKGFFIRIYIGE